MPRRLLPLIALGVLLPAGPAQAQRDCNLGRIDGGSFSYRICGRAHDLDQVRRSHVGRPGRPARGLPGHGRQYCVPTAVMDHLAWLADRDLVSRPPSLDWGWRRMGEPFDEMSRYIRELGRMMGTSATAGTGAGGMPGIRQWLAHHARGTTELRGSDVVTRAFGAGRSGGADLTGMVSSALAGGLVSVVVGYYEGRNPSKDVPDERMVRTGGHAMALTEAASLGFGEAPFLLTVSDPGTAPDVDDEQSFYRSERLELRPGATEPLVTKEGHAYTAVLHKVRGTARTYYDGWFSLAPKTIVYSPLRAQTVALRDSLALIRGAVENEFPTPGRILDAELLPGAPVLAYLEPGSDALLMGDRLSGDTTAVATGLAGPRELAAGGDAGTLFVSDGSLIASLDPTGQVLGTVKAPAPVDELEYDARRERLVALSGGARRLQFFDDALRPEGATRVPGSALDGGGALSLAINARGQALIRRDGSDELAVLGFGGRGARAAKVSEKELPLRRGKGLAVDDDGHIFVADRGRIVELTPAGKRVRRSRFARVPAATVLTVARSYDNVDRAVAPSLDRVPSGYAPTSDGGWPDEKGRFAAGVTSFP